jgi:hypothetical protein
MGFGSDFQHTLSVEHSRLCVMWIPCVMDALASEVCSMSFSEVKVLHSEIVMFHDLAFVIVTPYFKSQGCAFSSNMCKLQKGMSKP